jgi:type IV secretory pathway TrbD component
MSPWREHIRRNIRKDRLVMCVVYAMLAAFIAALAWSLQSWVIAGLGIILLVVVIWADEMERRRHINLLYTLAEKAEGKVA